MKSFSDKTEIRKSKLFDRVTLENESKINKRVGSNKNMYAGKKCQKLKRVYMFIKQTRVCTLIIIYESFGSFSVVEFRAGEHTGKFQ